MLGNESDARWRADHRKDPTKILALVVGATPITLTTRKPGSEQLPAGRGAIPSPRIAPVHLNAVWASPSGVDSAGERALESLGRGSAPPPKVEARFGPASATFRNRTLARCR